MRRYILVLASVLSLLLAPAVMAKEMPKFLEEKTLPSGCLTFEDWANKAAAFQAKPVFTGADAIGGGIIIILTHPDGSLAFFVISADQKIACQVAGVAQGGQWNPEFLKKMVFGDSQRRSM